MVKIQSTVSSSKAKGPEEYLIEEDKETPSVLPVKKESSQWLVNFIGILMGLALMMCFMYAYVHGRPLFLHWRCRNKVTLDNAPTVEYLSHTSDVKKVEDYIQWVQQEMKDNCSFDCLSWASRSSLFDDQHLKSVLEPVHETLRMHNQNQCDDMPVNLRFDCLPGGNANKKTCESRGCCWKPLQELPPREKPFSSPRLHRPTHGMPLENLSLNVPYCYYPSNYDGYYFVNYTDESYGQSGYLKRDTSSGYPRDVTLLKIDVFYETPTRLRVKIYDAHHVRWESPLPVVTKTNNSAAEPLYSISIVKDSASFTIFRKSSGLPLFDTRNAAPLVFSDQFLQLSTQLPSEYIYGLGEHLEGLLLDTYWKRRVLWNLDQIPEPGKNTYGSHPFYLAMEPDGNAHGIFLLNSNAIDVVLQPTPAVTFKVIGGVLDLYVFLGPSPNEVISQYTELVGRPFLPPYWSLGYHQCRFRYNTLNRTRMIWKRTRDAGIPFDVQWNDLDYMEDSKDFTYDHIQFKELPEFVQELHQVGMHYIPLIDPGISASEPLHTYPPWDEGLALHAFVRNSSNMPFVGKVWNPVATTWPDFTQPLATYYWGRQLLRFHSNVQIDGAWIDMNEPSNFWSGDYFGCRDNNLNHPPFVPHVHGEVLYYHTVCMAAKHYLGPHYNVHNLYGLTEAIATNKVLQIVRGKRPFIISRSTFAGQGHYSGHWTGDVWSDWFNLWQSIPSILNFNMFGIPMVGADICGFHGNATSSLCLRWMQLGAFYPFSRNHNEENSIDQDPVAMGEDVVKASVKALKIRYMLLPYLYSLFFRSHLTGEPVARPLFFQFPKDQRTYAIDTQFMWGSGLMIAPVLEENVTQVNAYIPEGCWYDWYSGALIKGYGSYEILQAPKDVIPLLIRGGSVIPTQSPGNTTTQSRNNPMGLVVAPDKDGSASGEWFWDDGDTLDTAKTLNYTHVDFSAKPGSLHVEVTLAGYKAPAWLEYLFILGVKEKVSHVYVDGVDTHFMYDEGEKMISIDSFKRSLLSSFFITWE